MLHASGSPQWDACITRRVTIGYGRYIVLSRRNILLLQPHSHPAIILGSKLQSLRLH
jgi:hypothetical protein